MSKLSDFADAFARELLLAPIESRIDGGALIVKHWLEGSPENGVGITVNFHRENEDYYAYRLFYWDNRITCGRKITSDYWTTSVPNDSLHLQGVVDKFHRYAADRLVTHEFGGEGIVPYLLFDLTCRTDPEEIKEYAETILMKITAVEPTYEDEALPAFEPTVTRGEVGGSNQNIGCAALFLNILRLKGIDPAPYERAFHRLVSNRKAFHRLV